MKPGKDSDKKTDSDPVIESVKEGEGIDALMLLQIIGGILAVIFLVWIIFHGILHLF